MTDALVVFAEAVDLAFTRLAGWLVAAVLPGARRDLERQAEYVQRLEALQAKIDRELGREGR